MNGTPGWVHPVPKVVRRGQLLRQNRIALTIEDVVGVTGYYAGPDVQILRRLNALCDPLLARLPMVERDPIYLNWIIGFTYQEPEHPWRIGHFRRILPTGYLKTIVTGENRVQEMEVARLYDQLRLVTRGPLWDGDRFLEIIRLNLGLGSNYPNVPGPLQGYRLE